eukprot:6197023-Pleurochrysis_carterae.AAC.2
MVRATTLLMFTVRFKAAATRVRNQGSCGSILASSQANAFARQWQTLDEHPCTRVIDCDCPGAQRVSRRRQCLMFYSLNFVD